ncbi:hypothetical protein FRC09_008665 [Ceratobasidium sp. 395]|nr:hypothetical protein FRC09_008665 [Ceratobasidium sp. 395]
MITRWSPIVALLLGFALVKYILNNHSSFIRELNEVVKPSLIPSEVVPLAHLFNNIASGPSGNFDGAGSAFPAGAVPRGDYAYDRILFQFPELRDGQNDNVVTNGEVLELGEPKHTREMHILYAGDFIDGAVALLHM